MQNLLQKEHSCISQCLTFSISKHVMISKLGNSWINNESWSTYVLKKQMCHWKEVYFFQSGHVSNREEEFAGIWPWIRGRKGNTGKREQLLVHIESDVTWLQLFVAFVCTLTEHRSVNCYWIWVFVVVDAIIVPWWDMCALRGLEAVSICHRCSSINLLKMNCLILVLLLFFVKRMVSNKQHFGKHLTRLFSSLQFCLSGIRVLK